MLENRDYTSRVSLSARNVQRSWRMHSQQRWDPPPPPRKRRKLLLPREEEADQARRACEPLMTRPSEIFIRAKGTRRIRLVGRDQPATDFEGIFARVESRRVAKAADSRDSSETERKGESIAHVREEEKEEEEEEEAAAPT